jgi:hypothetical protein
MLTGHAVKWAMPVKLVEQIAGFNHYVPPENKY